MSCVVVVVVVGCGLGLGALLAKMPQTSPQPGVVVLSKALPDEGRTAVHLEVTTACPLAQRTQAL